MKPLEEISADIKLKTEEEAQENRFGRQENKVPVLQSSTMSILEGFFTVMEHIYSKDQKFRDDFRIALVKTQENFKNKGYER